MGTKRACLVPVAAAALSVSAAAQKAGPMQAPASARSAITVVVGPCESALLAEVSADSGFVQVLLCNERRVSGLRCNVRARGIGHKVSVTGCSGFARLPYAENLVNRIVVPDWKAAAGNGLRAKELARVLAPLGEVRIAAPGAQPRRDLTQAGLQVMGASPGDKQWLLASRPWPEGIDQWTHYLHGADGNPVAADELVGPPRRFQWITGPTWMRSHESDSSISSLITAAGRVYLIIDEAPASIMGDRRIPGKWALIARDAFNGGLLWRVPIERWGWQEWKPLWFTARPGDFPLNRQKRLVAHGSRVYATLGFRAPVSQLDGSTGAVLQSYKGTEGTNELLYRDGLLLVAVLDDIDSRPYAQRAERKKAGKTFHVAAIRAADGNRLWRTERSYSGSTTDYIRFFAGRGGKFPVAQLDPAADLATDGKTVVLRDKAHLVGLDFATGIQKWRIECPGEKADANAGRVAAVPNLWVASLIVKDGVVVQATPHRLSAFSSETGEALWKQAKSYIGHLWYSWKDVFVINGLVWTWGQELGRGEFTVTPKRTQRANYPRFLAGYNLRTGKRERRVELGNLFNAHHHHRCYRNKATTRFILASRRGTEFVDLQGGKHTVDNWVRGMCHLGMMPANGLQYVPPHPCACYIDEKLNGFLALSSSPPPDLESPKPRPVQKGPAFNTIGNLKSQIADPLDWPAFRGNNQRSGATSAQIQGELRLLWRTKPGRKAGVPIAVGEQVYVPLPDENHLAALRASDGEILWNVGTGARIDSPPAYWRGALFFGSADGYVYCVRAAGGELAWRWQAAPQDRWIGAFGKLESAWPVHGSVLVVDDTAYCTAGRSSHMDGGFLLYALDAGTGTVKHRRTFTGPRYDAATMKQNFRLPMGALPDILVGEAGGIGMRRKRFSHALDPMKGGPVLNIPAGFLDGAYFKRMPWRYLGMKRYGRLISYDARSIVFLRMFDDLTPLSHKVFFSPGRKGYTVVAVDAEKPHRNQWAVRVPVRGRAMALSANRIVLAGPPDTVPKNDPLAAFEGRLGGVLCLLDRKDGNVIQKLTTPAPAVFHGIAIAQGRLILTLEDGSVMCFGGKH